MIKRMMAGGAALAVLAAGLVAASTAPAAAATRCAPVVHTNSDGITTVAGGAFELTDKGVRAKTAANPDGVSWWSQAFKVRMSDVTSLGYETYKYDTAAPFAVIAVRARLDIDNDGTADATIIGEPYYRDANHDGAADGGYTPPAFTDSTWDALKDFTWWSSTTIPGLAGEGGGSYAGNKSWAAIATANPNARVVQVGWGLGTYNSGSDVRIRSLTFGSKLGCKTHSWKKPVLRPHWVVSVVDGKCDALAKSVTVKNDGPVDIHVKLGGEAKVLKPGESVVVSFDKGKVGLWVNHLFKGWFGYVKPVCPTATPTATASATASPSASASASTSASPTGDPGSVVTTAPAPGVGGGDGGGSNDGGGELALTGSTPLKVASGGGAFLIVGLLLFFLFRRRRSEDVITEV